MQNKLTAGDTPSDAHRYHQAAEPKVRVGPPKPDKTKPAIDVHKRDGRVESLVITCACGERITVVCDYAEKDQ